MKPMFDRVWVLTTAVVLSLSPVALAQPRIPIPDLNGDYYSNDAPVKGSTEGSQMAGSLWQVTAARLNCYHTPGRSYGLVRQFRQGDVLQAEVYRGGSDEVLVNARDTAGKPWMPVRGRTLDDLCYVRANRRYIKPVVDQP